MTSFRQIEANRRNARKSTGPITEEGKQHSRCNAVRHGLTAETVIGALEDAEDYKAFEAAIIADYDVQSAVERELVLRLAGLDRQTQLKSQEIIYKSIGQVAAVDTAPDLASHSIANGTEVRSSSGLKSVDPATHLARCFLRLANLTSYPLDRLSRYEAILWRQASQILIALQLLDRRRPQERGRRFHIGIRENRVTDERDDY
jgi:hypothetical protein